MRRFRDVHERLDRVERNLPDPYKKSTVDSLPDEIGLDFSPITINDEVDALPDQLDIDYINRKG